MRVAYLDAPATHDLRRRVLRAHLPGSAVENPEDDLASTTHVGVVDDRGIVVGVATVFPQPTPHRPGARALRLRGMAVDDPVRGRGVGRLLLDAVVELARRHGYEVVWANGRDTALEFYRRHGWEVVGEGFETMALPHHVVLLDLVRSG
ncbi:MAG: GNAT family N-acetyltransferase [Actinomycetota bacterium]|nr:GNAT family N-acetyltransferase [Actinomycetota bacterium]